MTSTTLHRQIRRERFRRHAIGLGGSAWKAALAWLARRGAAPRAEASLGRTGWTR